MRLYHRTSADNAAAILSDGFRDSTDRYMTDRAWTGVWLSDRPLDANEGAWGNALLAVEWPDQVSLEPFEWVEEGRRFREFLIPARVINESARVHMLPALLTATRSGKPWQQGCETVEAALILAGWMLQLGEGEPLGIVVDNGEEIDADAIRADYQRRRAAGDFD